MAVGRPVKMPEQREYPPIPDIRPEARATSPELHLSERKGFEEVELAFPEDEAQREANRCLNCGVCSECMECVKACPAQAVDHTMQDEFMDVEVGTIILSPGYDMIEPEKVRGEFCVRHCSQCPYEYGVRAHAERFGAECGRGKTPV